MGVYEAGDDRPAACIQGLLRLDGRGKLRFSSHRGDAAINNGHSGPVDDAEFAHFEPAPRPA